MKLHHLELYKLLNKNKAIHKFAKRPPTAFCSYHTTSFFSIFVHNQRKKKKPKYFHVTDNTARRLKNIPIEDINGPRISQLRSKANDTGVVYFDNGKHFSYAISKAAIFIMTSSMHRQSHRVNNPEFMVSTIMDSFIYINFLNEKIMYWINSPLDMIYGEEDTLLKREKESVKILQKWAAEMKKHDPPLTFKEQLELPSPNIIGSHAKHYQSLVDTTALCLQGFLFIYFADVITKTMITQKDTDDEYKARLFKQKVEKNNIIEVDTIYDETIKVINPFNVRGHFRNQPYGPNKELTKLIYIDAFMKKGYTRLATKIKEDLDLKLNKST